MSIVAGIEEDSPYDRFYPITRAMANATYAAQVEAQASDDQALAAQPSATADGMKLVDGLFAAVDAEHQQFVSSVDGRVDRLRERVNLLGLSIRIVVSFPLTS